MIKGETIDLHPITENDIEWLRKTRNQYSDDFFTSDYIKPEQQRAWYEHYKESSTDKMFIIRLKNGIEVGTIALYNINIADRTANIGRMLILDDFRGCGYMKEALTLLTGAAFKTMHLYKLRLDVFLDNAQAIGLYASAGYRSVKRPIMLMEAVNFNYNNREAFCMPDFGGDD